MPVNFPNLSWDNPARSRACNKRDPFMIQPRTLVPGGHVAAESYLITLVFDYHAQ
jgi:hypothetical protein